MLTLICGGYSNADIAARSHLSGNTIKSYVRTCCRKIDVRSRPQAVVWG